MLNPPVSLADVLAARNRIGPYITTTPLVRSETMSQLTGGEVFLKLETEQATRSFKARGALNALMQLPRPAGLVVTASAGNHGRALAWAGEQLGVEVLVFTPRSAPRAKTDAIRRHGAALRAEAANYEEAERQARRFAAENGAVFISPYNHPYVVAGTGTIALELLHQLPTLDTVVAPIGGGGLIGGVAVALRAMRPSMELVGAECEASAAFTAATAAGRVVAIEVGQTIADGLGGNVEPETITWPLIRDLVDRIVVVRERDIAEGIRRLARDEHVIAEGAGATGVAAVRANLIDLKGRTCAAVVSGGNIDPDVLERLIDEA